MIFKDIMSFKMKWYKKKTMKSPYEIIIYKSNINIHNVEMNIKLI